MSPDETAKIERRCARCRIWPRLLSWGLLFLLAIEAARQWRSRPVPVPFKKDAQLTAMTIFNAIDQFYTEYDKTLVPTSAMDGKDRDTDTSAEENLISILKGIDGGANSKLIDFLGDIKDAKIENGQPVNGLVRTRTTAALLDPWGHPYFLRLDGDGDGFVEDPANPGQQIKKMAIVWSAGKDGDPKTWNDNVGSWQTGN